MSARVKVQLHLQNQQSNNSLQTLYTNRMGEACMYKIWEEPHDRGVGVTVVQLDSQQAALQDGREWCWC